MGSPGTGLAKRGGEIGSVAPGHHQVEDGRVVGLRCASGQGFVGRGDGVDHVPAPGERARSIFAISGSSSTTRIRGFSFTAPILLERRTGVKACRSVRLPVAWSVATREDPGGRRSA